MTKTLGFAALLAGMLLAGSLSVQAASGAAGERIQLAQMNSPGDGISSGAASTGNGRRSGMRHHRGRHHHRHHRH